MRLLRPILLAALLAALAGCDSGESDPQPQAAEARVVHEWIAALKNDDYGRAAGYFARGAIVDQGTPLVLPTPRAARAFNAGLPCRADVIDVDDEPGPKALASFRLRAGPGGPCNGIVQVRVTVRDGRFTEWRQLPQEPEPSGPVV